MADIAGGRKRARTGHWLAFSITDQRGTKGISEQETECFRLSLILQEWRNMVLLVSVAVAISRYQ